MSYEIVKMRRRFRNCKQILKRMQAVDAPGTLDAYFKLQAELNAELNRLLSEPFDRLPKKDFQRLCTMVGTHRPCPPHSFLSCIALRLQETERQV